MKTQSPKTEKLALPYDKHFYLHMYVLIERIFMRLNADGLLENILTRFPFLQQYQAQLTAANHWEHELESFARDLGMAMPLSQIDHDLALMLTAFGMIEEDVRIGAFFAYLSSNWGIA